MTRESIHYYFCKQHFSCFFISYSRNTIILMLIILMMPTSFLRCLNFFLFQIMSCTFSFEISILNSTVFILLPCLSCLCDCVCVCMCQLAQLMYSSFLISILNVIKCPFIISIPLIALMSSSRLGL